MTDAPKLWLNPEKIARFLKQMPGDDGIIAFAAAMDIAILMADKRVEPFNYDDAAAEKILAKHAKTSWRAVSAEKLRQLRPYLMLFFVILPDGRWMPKPDVFTSMNPYANERGKT